VRKRKVDFGGAMKLNRWQRTGIVISVCWMLGAGIYARMEEIHTAQEIAGASYGQCIYSHPSTMDYCSEKFSQDFKLLSKPYWFEVAWLALVPVLLGWGISFLFIRIYRWVKAGSV